MGDGRALVSRHPALDLQGFASSSFATASGVPMVIEALSRRREKPCICHGI